MERGSLLITYKEHAQRDKFPLLADVCYPNLAFEDAVGLRLRLLVSAPN